MPLTGTKHPRCSKSLSFYFSSAWFEHKINFLSPNIMMLFMGIYHYVKISVRFYSWNCAFSFSHFYFSCCLLGRRSIGRRSCSNYIGVVIVGVVAKVFFSYNPNNNNTYVVAAASSTNTPPPLPSPSSLQTQWITVTMTIHNYKYNYQYSCYYYYHYS